ncbi:MAG: hypothetical protein KGJ80_16280 [Chloroflexota bacterium]|nr:hypothetical protein [Chloroflexota bacterium]
MPVYAIPNRPIAALVEQMLQLHPRLHTAQTAADRELLQRQIDATDAQTARPALWALPQRCLICRRD